jgi:hypothetical protein
MNFTYTGFAAVLKGLEPLLAQELEGLGAQRREARSGWRRIPCTLNDRLPRLSVVADRESHLARIGPFPDRFHRGMAATFDVRRDHIALLNQTLFLLEPDGILLFSTNCRKFHLDEKAVEGYAVESITHLTLPLDFERNSRIHQCWRIRRPATRD